MAYIYETRLSEELIGRAAEVISTFGYFIKHREYEEVLPITCIRHYLQESLPICKEIRKAGFEDGHYRIYLKETNT